MLQDKIKKDENTPNMLWVHLYKDEQFLRKFILGFIDSKDSTIIAMQKKVKETRGEDQKYHKNDGFAFNRQFLELAESRGVFKIRLKIDLLDDGVRKVYMIPIADILANGDTIHHNNCEAQVSIRSAYLLEYFEYEQKLDAYGKVIKKSY